MVELLCLCNRKNVKSQKHSLITLNYVCIGSTAAACSGLLRGLAEEDAEFKVLAEKFESQNMLTAISTSQLHASRIFLEMSSSAPRVENE